VEGWEVGMRKGARGPGDAFITERSAGKQSECSQETDEYQATNINPNS